MTEKSIEPPMSNLIDHLSSIHECESTDFRWSSLRILVKKYVCKTANDSGNDPNKAALSILDVGCGTGHVSLDLLKNNFNIVAIDRSQEMIDFAKEVITKFGYRAEVHLLDVMDSRSLGENRFDFVICLDVIEHIKQDGIALENMNYLLKPGGKMILVVPAIKYLYGVRDEKMGHYRRYNKKDLINKLHENGFEIIELRYWNFLGFFPFLISEKVLHKNIRESFRYSNEKKNIILNTLISQWFLNIENNLKLPMGLSLFAVVKKIKN